MIGTEENSQKGYKRTKKRSTDSSITYYGSAKKAGKSHPVDTTIKNEALNVDIDFEISVRDIMDSYPFYALLIDEDHHILQANTSVLDVLATEPEKIVGKLCPAVVHGTDGPFHGCPLEEAIERNEGVERDVYDQHSKRWLRSAIYPTITLTKDGKRVFFHMVTDITETKEAEKQLQIAHKRMRSLSAFLESVREEERKKIVHDLHDEASQILASLSAHLEALARTLPTNSDKAQTLLNKAQELTINVFDEIGRLIYELRPTLLDNLGLLASINSLVENNLEQAGINVDIKILGEVKRLPQELEIALFRVIQEIFSNIIRHAQAENVKVRMQFKKSSARINIADDGIGFNVQETINSINGPRGFGLLGIKERIEILSGIVDIRSCPGGGTTINIEVPISQKAQTNNRIPFDM